jgi:hypothetical protein
VGRLGRGVLAWLIAFDSFCRALFDREPFNPTSDAGSWHGMTRVGESISTDRHQFTFSGESSAKVSRSGLPPINHQLPKLLSCLKPCKCGRAV